MRAFRKDMKHLFSSMSVATLLLLVTSGCEYEFKDEGAGASKVVLLEHIPRVLSEQQQNAERPDNKKPEQPPDVRPTLAPGKDVSGTAALPEKAKKLNLPDLFERGLVSVTTNVSGLGDLPNAFDEVESSLSKSEGTNPFIFTFEFQNPQMLRAVRVLSTYSDYSWAVQVDGSTRLVVDTVIDGQWSTVAWPEGVKAKKIKVEVLRKLRDNYVHLNEVEFYE